MNYRKLGKTDLAVPEIGFGCGSIGGLMVRGEFAEQERAVRRALELGVTYFDTAPSYGDGRSEENLGRVLTGLGAEVLVGTKFRVDPDELGEASAIIRRSLEASLRRLDRDYLEIYQLHSRITAETGSSRGSLSAERARPAVAGNPGDALSTGSDYEKDLLQSQALRPLAQMLGFENTLELAVRFALGKSGVSTVLAGVSSSDHLDQLVLWAERGGLNEAVTTRVLGAIADAMA